MIITTKIARILGTAGLLLSASLASAEVVVIVNAASPISSATADDIAKVFLGKANDLGGNDVVPVDQSEGSAVRTQFYEKVVQKNESQLTAYWSRLIFTGKGTPPKQVGKDADVVDSVATDEEAVGYVDSSAVAEGVKVIFTAK
ncbi:MAG TPA: hypothetical protein VM553_04860 [Dongiaceae bacterium]|nr:hypothetical protein [Dongiaceae bacterium]